MVRLLRQEVPVVVLGCYYHFPKWYYQFQKSGSKFGRDGPTTRDGRVLGIFLTPMMLSAAVRRRDWSSAAANAAPIVLQLGDARLRRRCQKCDLKDAATLAIERDLHAALEDFRLRNGYGRAISAPQIGHAVRMVACNLGSSAIHRPGKQPFTLVNPEITWRSKETLPHTARSPPCARKATWSPSSRSANLVFSLFYRILNTGIPYCAEYTRELTVTQDDSKT